MLKTKKHIPLVLAQFALFVIFGSAFVKTAIAQSSAIQYAALQKGQRDCVAGEAVDSLCRVKRMPTINVLQSHLKKVETSWIEGNEVVFAYQNNADSVEVYGGSAWAMTKLLGTDIWTLVLQVPDVKRAVVSYQFMVSKGDDIKIEPQTPNVFRGPKAPPAPPQATTLKGTLSEEAIQSSNLSESRSLTVYSPPLKSGEQIAAVIYIADGKAVQLMAPYVEPLIVSRRLPPVLLVGVHRGKVLPGVAPKIGDLRALEYLLGFGETDSRFEAHERFLMNEVLPWVEAKFNAPKNRNKRAFFGASNGGSFALAMGIRHPNVFGHIIAFSPTWSLNLSSPSWTPEQAPSQYLLVGSLESASTRKLVKDWAEVAQKNKATVTMNEVVTGHDSVVWREWFPNALLTEFGKTKTNKHR
jgi:enterochelin esterase-like enzyme